MSLKKNFECALGMCGSSVSGVSLWQRHRKAQSLSQVPGFLPFLTSDLWDDILHILIPFSAPLHDLKLSSRRR